MRSGIYFRALEKEDYKTTISWRKDDEIWGMLTGPKYFVSSEYEKKWISEASSNQNEIRLGICLKKDDLLIGMASVTNIDYINRSGNFSIMIGNKNYWNTVHVFHAYYILLGYWFFERNMERLWGAILESNTASLRMAETAGKVEGILRNSIFKNGRYHNQVLFSILKDDAIQKYTELNNRY